MKKTIPQYLVSVIIPCFNEQEVILETYTQISEILKEHNICYELIFVNDGSTDNTSLILEKIATNDEAVLSLNFSRNFGHQPAVTAGLHYCKGDYAVIMDADLQDPPQLIPKMLEMALEKNANVIYAVRNTRKGEGIFKKLSAKIYYRLVNYLSDVELPLDTGDFRLVDRKVINTFAQLKEKHKYIRGLLTWVGFKQYPIFYDRDPRFAGETHYPFFKMVIFATKSLFYFTKKPLKLATNVGFLSVFVGLLLVVYVFISRFLHPERIASGWSSVLISILFFGGVQLLTIGVLGEYIGNIFDEVKNRPEYIIDTIFKKEKTE